MCADGQNRFQHPGHEIDTVAKLYIEVNNQIQTQGALTFMGSRNVAS
jgi:hypothetical protein